jgi:hypothetical protein
MHKSCFIMAPHLVVEKPNPSVASTANTARAANGRTKIVTRPPSWTQNPPLPPLRRVHHVAARPAYLSMPCPRQRSTKREKKRAAGNGEQFSKLIVIDS